MRIVQKGRYPKGHNVGDARLELTTSAAVSYTHLTLPTKIV